MRILLSILALGLTGFYSVTHPPHPLNPSREEFELTQPKEEFFQPAPPEIFRVQVTPHLIVIQMKGPIKIKNLAPKCSLYYGLKGEPLKVGEGAAQVDQNEVKPMSEKTIRATGVLSLVCSPGQAFPIEIQKLPQ